jgi:hypothetical protein
MPNIETLAAPRNTEEQLVGGLIEALTAAIDLIDQYEAPRKAQCGASSVTRNACEYVLRQAKAHTANDKVRDGGSVASDSARDAIPPFSAPLG